MAARQMNQGFSLKDHLFNRNRVTYLANCSATSNQEFDPKGFVRDTMKGFQALELKQRIVHIAATLERQFTSRFQDRR